MIPSRRQFFRLATGATVAAFPSPLMRASWAIGEPARFDEDDQLIRLHSNENAYGPSTKVLEAIKLAGTGANRYPRLHYPALVEQIASSHGVTPDRVLLGCGSTEILRAASFAFLGKGGRLIVASPTFEAIQRYAVASGADVVAVPLTASFAHDLEAMRAGIDSATTLVYICNPNNPTASTTPRKALEEFLSKLPPSVFVVIDEAYHHYAETSGMYKSFIDDPVDNDRVIVARTFSKVYGLAGLRLGYAVAAKDVVRQMGKFLSEDNINAIAVHAAVAALNDQAGTRDFVQRNANDRQEFFNQAMGRALKPIDSHANFVMMNTFHPADEIIEHFKKNNILIGRHFPPLDTYIRVSLGRPEDMLAFWRTWDRLPYARKGMAH